MAAKMTRTIVDENIDHHNGASTPASDDVIVFGRFKLNRTRHELLVEGVPVPIGSRAMEILLALTEVPGELMSIRELLRIVWPNAVVEEGTVRVQVASLRRTLRDVDPYREYVRNVTGRGYRFVAPVSKYVTSVFPGSPDPDHDTPVNLPVQMPPQKSNLPPRLTSIVGRVNTIRTLADKLPTQRFVTITGAAGSGKTTVALEVATTLLNSYPGGIYFIDLASITEGGLIANAFASALGIANPTEGSPSDLITWLSGRAVLLILDNCEHVIGVAAALAENILRQTLRVHVLATSREPLRAAGEWIYDLSPLATPSETGSYTRAELLKFPAIELFVERAKAYDGAEFGEADLQWVADICRRLDGNPLAIEITAAHVRLLGLKMIATSLFDDLYLSISGRRTAEPRQQSLKAAFDWSYGLLSELEKATFRRLSVFTGCFDLDCAVAVVNDGTQTFASIFASLMSLAQKSLLQVDSTDANVSYRLLDVPRGYARQRLVELGEQEVIRRRHAQMWCSVGAAKIEQYIRPSAEGSNRFGTRIHDLWAAIRWSFSSGADSPLDVKLKLASLWFELVLAAESSGEPVWAQLYTSILDEPDGTSNTMASDVEDVLEMSGPRNDAPVYEATVLQQIARSEAQLKSSLWSLWFERVVKRDYRIAIDLANAACQRGTRSNAHEVALVDRMLAVAYFYAGDQILCHKHGQWALETAERAAPSSFMEEGLAQCHTRTVVARALWLRGFADQALEVAHRSIAEAERSGNPRMMCMTLLVTTVMSMWCGKSDEVERALNRMHEQSTLHSLHYHQLWVECLRAIISEPVGSLRNIESMCLTAEPHVNSQYFDFLGSFREELVSADVVTRFENGICGWLEPEFLRIKAERLYRAGGNDAAASAAGLLETAMVLSRQQGALAWELRAAMSLARVWKEQGRTRDAKETLTSVYERFTEGFETADLIAARRLLAEIQA